MRSAGYGGGNFTRVHDLPPISAALTAQHCVIAHEQWETGFR
jgi:hypothetical protein